MTRGRRNGKDRRFKQNNDVIYLICHNGVARGIARGRASGFVRGEGDLPGPEQQRFN